METPHTEENCGGVTNQLIFGLQEESFVWLYLRLIQSILKKQPSKKKKNNKRNIINDTHDLNTQARF